MYVIKNGTLYTMSDAGVVRADLRVEDGKITEIGTDLPLNGGECVDASSLAVSELIQMGGIPIEWQHNASRSPLQMIAMGSFCS